MSVLDDFRAGVKARDPEAMAALFTEDAVLNSPVSFKPFHGREAITTVFRALLETFEDFRYIDEFPAEDRAALMFAARVGDRELQGLDWFRFTEDEQIAELTVMVRPMSGVIALAEAMGPKLAAA
jgi:nuclear transport factor 2 (NTF2) superfamily protein